jgi:uncharacterized protein YbaR (Trm112 family)
MIDKDLIKILACPKCKGDVEVTSDKVICRTCKKYYRIENDVPVMLVDEANDL